MAERAEIEAKVREIEAVVDQTKQAVKDRTMIAAAGGIGLVILSFLWGRRRGRKAAAVVEVYKVT